MCTATFIIGFPIIYHEKFLRVYCVFRVQSEENSAVLIHQDTYTAQGVLGRVGDKAAIGPSDNVLPPPPEIKN